ncbi:MAG: alanine--tRNA ligase [Candidatus Gastranaerophilales bacterium]|nr:alanine--tRNA ligase [Candidatus Gastranaerophilales bacterium]
MNDKKILMSGKEIRKKFIDFFVHKHSHRPVKSSNLIPDNPTVLLTPAGMLQFVPIFLGYEKPPEPPRAVSVQKCARAGGKDSDIENVGRTPRHHTFFEMLGNFSFGDYFKNEIIPWSWDFVTNELKLEKSRLWITIFETDDEAYEIWKNKVGIPEERILRKGKKDNFWGPPGPTGPCGPCTEIHYDLGEEYACGPNCSIDTCECDRYVEIWNLVFMELNKDEEGNFTPLERKNVDTGMGLERVTMVVNGFTSTFETDLLYPILEKVCEMSGKKYKQDHKTDVSLRIITDHARCVTFLISDGLIPANEGRNYVLRMILRRALRHGKLLGLELPFLYTLVDTVVDIYSDVYPELLQNKTKIIDVIKNEEERFKQTIGRGQSLLDEVIEKALKTSTKVISGEDSFKLYDTYGFPLELTVEIAQEQGLTVDMTGFNAAMEEQRERAKSAQSTVRLTDELIYVDVLNHTGPSVFLGYCATESKDCTVKALIKEGEKIETAQAGDSIDLILDKTPFYAESGGQIGDSGHISGEGFKAEVITTVKFDALVIHKAKILSGSLKIGNKANTSVDTDRRKDITIHHTAAHLLQAALRKIADESITQAGSQIFPDRARFDFKYDKALTPDQITAVENLINLWINENLKRETIETTLDEARELGAIALFDEKYGDKVRFVKVGEISKELCGGTHADSTGELRLCKILSESAIASGVRRIELICGQYALNHLNIYAAELEKISRIFKVPPHESLSRVEKLIEESKQYQKKIKTLESEIAAGKVDTLLTEAKDISDGKILTAKVEGITPDALKPAVEKLSDKLGNSIVILASVFDGKVSIIAKVSKNFTDKGIKAGEIVNEIATMCEGRGGGSPNFAQAGAKNPGKLDEALSFVYDKLLGKL